MTSKYFDAVRQALENFNVSHVQDIRQRLEDHDVGSNEHIKAYNEYYDLANRVYDPGSYVNSHKMEITEEDGKEFDKILEHHPVTALSDYMIAAGCDQHFTTELLKLIDDLGY